MVSNVPYSLIENLKGDFIITMEDDLNQMQKKSEKYNIPCIIKTTKDNLMIQPKSNYGQFAGIEKKEEYFSLMIFRGVSLDKRTVRTLKDEDKK